MASAYLSVIPPFVIFNRIEYTSAFRIIEIHETGSRNSCRIKVQIYEKG
jgi:hypothetical protein